MSAAVENKAGPHDCSRRKIQWPFLERSIVILPRERRYQEPSRNSFPTEENLAMYVKQKSEHETYRASSHSGRRPSFPHGSLANFKFKANGSFHRHRL